MKTLPLILACLGSGFAGAATLNLLTPAPAQAESNQEDALATLRGELSALQEQGRSEREALEDRLARMEEEALLVSPVQIRNLVPDNSGQAINDGNVPMGTSSQAIRIGNSVVQPAQFEAWVRRASESIAAQEKAQRDQDRSIREGERIEDQIAKLTTDLGLDQHQQSEFRRHLQDSTTKRRDIFQAMRDGSGDRTSMRENMGKLREESDTDLKTFLNDDQYTTYKDSGADNAFGRGGRNNRGAGGGNNSRGGNNNGRGN